MAMFGFCKTGIRPVTGFSESHLTYVTKLHRIPFNTMALPINIRELTEGKGTGFLIMLSGLRSHWSRNAPVAFMEKENTNNSRRKLIGGIPVSDTVGENVHWRYYRNRIADTDDLTGWKFLAVLLATEIQSNQ